MLQRSGTPSGMSPWMSGLNGKTGMRIIIQKQSGANTVQVCQDIQALMPELMKSLPDDVEIITFFDSSVFIADSIDNLSSTLMYAAIAVILVVLFFLGRWRATFIIILTIPISLIVAFIYLYISGSSINIIALSSLSIAIGMVVDDAIVVSGKYHKTCGTGEPPQRSGHLRHQRGVAGGDCYHADRGGCIPALTLIGGMTGELFRPLGYIVSITVVTSTISAITLTPMLASKMMRLRKKPKKVRKSQLRQYHRTLSRPPG